MYVCVFVRPVSILKLLSHALSAFSWRSLKTLAICTKLDIRSLEYF